MNFVKRLSLLFLTVLPFAARAAGAHDKVGCIGCHPRSAIQGAFALAPNTKYLDPKTNQPYSGSTAICLACHQEPDKGGKGYIPISRHDSHPFGLVTINPKVAKVPPDMLRDGRFECMSCHDPHPSNGNYKYLRIDVGKEGEEMNRFCDTCHPLKDG